VLRPTHPSTPIGLGNKQSCAYGDGAVPAPHLLVDSLVIHCVAVSSCQSAIRHFCGDSIDDFELCMYKYANAVDHTFVMPYIFLPFLGHAHSHTAIPCKKMKKKKLTPFLHFVQVRVKLSSASI